MSRYIPPLSCKLASKRSSAVVYLYGTPDRLYAVAYLGRAEKSAWHYRFKTVAARAAYVSEWMAERDKAQAYVNTRKAEKRDALDKPCGLKVGDVLRSSWGYEQTNVDFYQVTKLIGPRMVEIREIEAEARGDDQYNDRGQCVPLPGAFKGEPMRKRVGVGDYVRITSYASAYKVEPIVSAAGLVLGYPKSYWSSYA